MATRSPRPYAAKAEAVAQDLCEFEGKLYAAWKGAGDDHSRRFRRVAETAFNQVYEARP
jgi:hypothetical protein